MRTVSCLRTIGICLSFLSNHRPTENSCRVSAERSGFVLVTTTLSPFSMRSRPYGESSTAINPNAMWCVRTYLSLTVLYGILKTPMIYGQRTYGVIAYRIIAFTIVGERNNVSVVIEGKAKTVFVVYLLTCVSCWEEGKGSAQQNEKTRMVEHGPNDDFLREQKWVMAFL